MKDIKTNKRSHMSDSSAKQRAILYSTARMNGSRIRNEAFERIDTQGSDTMFGVDDLR